MGRRDHPSFNGGDDADDFEEEEDIELDEESDLIGSAAEALDERITEADFDIFTFGPLRAQADMHDIMRFLDGLERQDAHTMLCILAWIENNTEPEKIANGLQWYLQARLQLLHDVCPVCEESHGEELERLHANGQMG